MNSHERFTRMFAHKEADRVPIIDSPWGATVERWQREGMPSDVKFEDFFGLDHVSHIGVDNSPRFATEILEETDSYTISKTPWGATLKNWKHIASVPEFLDFTIKDRPSWAEAKARMTPDADRIGWDFLRENYSRWRKEEHWIQAEFWFGFDVTHSWTVGTERLLMALLEDPDWCVDMFNHFLDLDIALMEQVWDAGYRFDSIMWPDDMGYRGHQFFSVATYRKILKPVHQRAVEWAHSKGVRAHLHSCGDVNPFVPELVEMGMDALNPLEVKAGMDPIALKKQWGDKLVLHGGINAAIWNDLDAIEAEVRRVVPVVMEGGGYIWSTDHSVPSCVSLKGFQHIVDVAKEVGSY